MNSFGSLRRNPDHLSAPKSKIYIPKHGFVSKIAVLKGYKIKYPMCIIPIGSPWKQYWNIIILFLILINSIFLPLQICFFGSRDGSFFDTFDYFTLIFFWMDILLNCRTTYFDEERSVEIVDSRMVMRHYFYSSHFMIDSFSAIPFKLFLSDGVQNVKLVKAIKVIKILRLLRAKRFSLIFANDKFRIIYKLFCLLIATMIIVRIR